MKTNESVCHSLPRKVSRRTDGFAATCGNVVYLFLSGGLGLIFILSGLAKLLDAQAFVIVIEAFGLIPEATVPPIALGLALSEVVAGAALLAGRRWALPAIAVLLSGFMLILGYGLWLGLDIDCGCFGPQDPEGRAYHGLRPALYRDIAMMAGIGFLFFWRRKSDPWTWLRRCGLIPTLKLRKGETTQ